MDNAKSLLLQNLRKIEAWRNSEHRGIGYSTNLNGFPWLKPKLELTTIATQKAIKIRRKTISLHFLLCLMTPPSWVLPSLDGNPPMTGPRGGPLMNS